MNPVLTHLNDALNYLPRRPLVEYPRGHVVYSGASDALYLVVVGRVKLSTIGKDGCEAIIRVVPPEGLFGEACLVAAQRGNGERAVALDKVRLMAWKRSDIEQQIEREPRLALALMEEMILNCLDMKERMQAMASCNTPERVMLSLIQLCSHLGELQPDGAMRMEALTHHTIAEHVGTSREIVSSQMNRLRRLGLVAYSRQHIDVYRDAMEEALRSKGLLSRHAGTVTTARSNRR